MTYINPSPEDERISSKVLFYLCALLIILGIILMISSLTSCNRFDEILKKDKEIMVQAARKALAGDCEIIQEELNVKCTKANE